MKGFPSDLSLNENIARYSNPVFDLNASFRGGTVRILGKSLYINIHSTENL